MSSSDSAYRVLARKYRPRTFDDLIGQEAMVRTLSNAFETGRIAQGYMLTGVRGIGKTTTARILARALNYEIENAGEQRPTIHMPSLGVHCQAIIDGRHVDVMEMDAASHTGIGDIREIIDAARYKPMSARYKVYIIDEVHMLSTAAFNGLLKTLEEPPEHVKFIFATTEIRKVPITVLSRCQRFDLRRIDTGVLGQHLLKIAGMEQANLHEDAAMVLARTAEGSVRDALSLLDQAMAQSGGGTQPQVRIEDVRAMLGLVDRERVYQLMELVMKGQAAEALQAFDAQYADGADPVQMIGELVEAVYVVTRFKVAPEAAQALGLPQGEATQARQLAEKLSLRVLIRAWQMVLKGYEEVKLAPRPVAAAQMLLVRLCHAADMPTPDELIRQIEAGRASGAFAGAAHSSSSAPASPPVARGDASSVHSREALGTTMTAQRVPQLVSSGSGSQASARAISPPQVAAPPLVELNTFTEFVALASRKQDTPLKVALERLVHLVHFERGQMEIRLGQGASPNLAGEIQKKISEWTGERWMVALSRTEGAPTLFEQKEEAKREEREDLRHDPLVAAVLSQFPGSYIVDVQVRLPEPEPVVPLDDISALTDDLDALDDF